MCTMQCPLEALVEIEPRLHRQNPHELHWKTATDGQTAGGGHGDTDKKDPAEKGSDSGGVDSWQEATVGRLEKVRDLVFTGTDQ